MTEQSTSSAGVFDAEELALLRAYLQKHGTPSTWSGFSRPFIKDASEKVVVIERLAATCMKLMALPDDEFWQMMRSLSLEVGESPVHRQAA